MSNNQVNELVEFVTEPKGKPKSPTNWALWGALIFANFVFFVLDVISGYTVYLITKWWGYGLLTVLAGFVPLVLHEAAFVRAYASNHQKVIATIGAMLSILSVIGIGIAAAIINVMGFGIQVVAAEISTVVGLVIISALHAFLCIAYFYTDVGIQTKQRTEQAIARGIEKSRMISASGQVLKTAQAALVFKNSIEKQYGPQGTEAMQVILANLLQDRNGDGIPDVLQQVPPARPMNQFSSSTSQPTLQQNPRGPADPNE